MRPATAALVRLLAAEAARQALEREVAEESLKEKTPEPGKAAGVEWELNDGCPGEHNSAAD